MFATFLIMLCSFRNFKLLSYLCLVTVFTTGPVWHCWYKGLTQSDTAFIQVTELCAAAIASHDHD